jgi:hypothetical protein
VVIQFYPPDVEATLAGLEQAKAGGRDLRQIRRTVFGVKSAGGRYEFFVVSQEFRNAP